jgi:hypothetical protein
VFLCCDRRSRGLATCLCAPMPLSLCTLPPRPSLPRMRKFQQGKRIDPLILPPIPPLRRPAVAALVWRGKRMPPPPAPPSGGRRGRSSWHTTRPRGPCEAQQLRALHLPKRGADRGKEAHCAVVRSFCALLCMRACVPVCALLCMHACVPVCCTGTIGGICHGGKCTKTHTPHGKSHSKFPCSWTHHGWLAYAVRAMTYFSSIFLTANRIPHPCYLTKVTARADTREIPML